MARIHQGSAQGFGIVPAESASSSNNGLSIGLPTGPTPEVAPVVEEKEDTVQLESNELENKSQELNVTVETPPSKKEAQSSSTEVIIAVEDSPTQDDESTLEDPQTIGDDTTSVMSFSEDAERIQESIRRKRKRNKFQAEDSYSSGSEKAIKTKLRNRRVIIDTHDSKRIKSNQDTTKPMEKADIENKRGVGRPKKRTKAVDPEAAEKEVLKKTGKAPEQIDKDLLKAMTASDICAQALEYTSHIEEIRTKCGRLQGGLSGELKKRIIGIEEYIRALQVKAETTGDPELLKHKINQLLAEIRKHKLEEQIRRREMEELHDIIKSLKHENKNIREEMRKIREEISQEKERRTIEEKREVLNKSKRNDKRHDESEWPVDGHKWNDDEIIYTKYFTPSPKKNKIYTNRLEKDGIYTDGNDIYTDEDNMHTERKEIISSEMEIEEKHPGKIKVMRPPIGGISTPIWIGSQAKEERQDIVKTQIQALEKRAKPAIRLLENRQLVPPRAEKEEREEIIKEEDKQDTTWTKVIKKGKNKKKEEIKEKKGKKEEIKDKREITIKTTKVKRRVPSTAAISIKGSKEEFSYAEALKKARTAISLEEMEINAPRIRKGMNGATIIEIKGVDNNKKADELATKIQDILKGEAFVTRPKIKGEYKLIGYDESISTDELVWTTAQEGDCLPEDVKVNSVRVTKSGLRIAWIKCPIEAAIKISKKGKVKVGWTIARAELLQARPLQCFRCWGLGHVKDKCKSGRDYKQHCYQCGKEGHQAKTCGNKPSCIICAELKMDSNHRVGSVKCKGVTVRQKDTVDTHTYEKSKEDNKSKEDTNEISKETEEKDIYKEEEKQDRRSGDNEMELE